MYTSLLISFLAVAVAACGIAYGIFERRAAATRAERIRLSVITDDLEKLKLELIIEAESGHVFGDRIEAINTRIELLAQQGLSLIREYELSANSAELRTVAYALGAIYYTEAADDVWRRAIDKGESEGDIQALNAARGYAYYLFRQGRLDEARQRLDSATSRFSATDDQGRGQLIETLYYWADWELRISGASSTTDDMFERIRALYSECQSPVIKTQIAPFCSGPTSGPTADKH